MMTMLLRIKYNKNYPNLIYIRGIFDRKSLKIYLTNLKNSQIFSEIIELNFYNLEGGIYILKIMFIKFGDYNIAEQINILVEFKR